MSLSCQFCGKQQVTTPICPSCGMQPRLAPSRRAAYRQLAGWILGS